MLTNIEVKGAKPAEKPYKMGDQGGLYLHVAETGSKLWRYRYRINGKQKLLALGQYPEMSLAEAREQHQAARKLVAAGVDPSAQKQADRAAQRAAKDTSFASVSAEWLRLFSSKSSDGHIKTTKGRMENHILPELGSIDVNNLTRPMVVSFAKQIEADHGRETADRCLMVIRQIMNHAADHGDISADIAEGIAGIKPDSIFQGKNNDVQSNHARVPLAELPALLRAIDSYQGMRQTGLAMRLMSLTLMRTGELIGLQWSEVDFKEKLIRISGERMKGGKPHTVVLSRQALEILSTLKQMNGTKETVCKMSNMAILKALDRMGYRGKQTGHGFRGLGSTLLHESGLFKHEVIETALAHQYRTAVAAAYDKAEYLEQRREMMQWLADEYDRLVGEAAAA
jgi:integrase